PQSRRPLPQISDWQPAEHPSHESTLPSSHSSAGSLVPSPHVGTAVHATSVGSSTGVGGGRIVPVTTGRNTGLPNAKMLASRASTRPATVIKPCARSVLSPPGPLAFSVTPPATLTAQPSTTTDPPLPAAPP